MKILNSAVNNFEIVIQKLLFPSLFNEGAAGKALKEYGILFFVLGQDLNLFSYIVFFRKLSQVFWIDW